MSRRLEDELGRERDPDDRDTEVERQRQGRRLADLLALHILETEHRQDEKGEKHHRPRERLFQPLEQFLARLLPADSRHPDQPRARVGQGHAPRRA